MGGTFFLHNFTHLSEILTSGRFEMRHITGGDNVAIKIPKSKTELRTIAAGTPLQHVIVGEVNGF